MKKLMTAVAALATTLMLPMSAAEAHCDSLDGPVAKAAQEALAGGNARGVLAYVPQSAEAELSAALARSLKVRGLGPEAQSLADQSFIETAVRLHRAGEGAAYTGLKPAGLDHGPAIPAAEEAIAKGTLTPLEETVVAQIRTGLAHRLAEVQETEPGPAADVAAARRHASAELGFITYAEALRQAAIGAEGHKE